MRSLSGMQKNMSLTVCKRAHTAGHQKQRYGFQTVRVRVCIVSASFKLYLRLHKWQTDYSIHKRICSRHETLLIVVELCVLMLHIWSELAAWVRRWPFHASVYCRTQVHEYQLFASACTGWIHKTVHKTRLWMRRQRYCVNFVPSTLQKYLFEHACTAKTTRWITLNINVQTCLGAVPSSGHPKIKTKFN